MKMIFEYNDGTYRIVPHLKLSKIEERTTFNLMVDQFITDLDVIRTYIVADDAHIGGFGSHRDIKNILANLEELYKQLNLQLKALNFYIPFENEM